MTHLLKATKHIVKFHDAWWSTLTSLPTKQSQMRQQYYIINRDNGDGLPVLIQLTTARRNYKMRVELSGAKH